MSVGIQEFNSADLQSTALQLGSDGKEGKTYTTTTQKKFKGTVFNVPISIPRRTKVAVKTFKTKKSTNRILKEATYQQKCAVVGASPPVLGVSITEKYIVMGQLDSLPAETYSEQEMPDSLQYMICGLMGRMDKADILHCDMNALNVMLDKDGRPWMIDFGLAKPVSKSVVKKHGSMPNVSVSLWGLVRGFKRYKTGCTIMEACVAADDPSEFIDRGETLLQQFKSKKRKR
tara:strand:- start:197 stop:889 length:693 start_codon:yes stop_codon:yes gene_type:complete